MASAEGPVDGAEEKVQSFKDRRPMPVSAVQQDPNGEMRGPSKDFGGENLDGEGAFGESMSVGTSRESPAFEEMGPQVTFDQLLEYLAIDSGLRRSCRSLPITLTLWITFVLLIFQHGQARGSYEAANFLSDAINAAAIPAALNGTSSFQGLTLDKIRENNQILPWLQSGLAPMLSTDGTSTNKMMEMQMLLGHVRVRQTRGLNTSTCSHLSGDYKAFYSDGCHPNSGVVGKYGPKRASYELEDYAFHPRPNRNNEYEMWLEIGRSQDVIDFRVETLAMEQWVDLNTQAISVTALFLNMEVHIYCVATIDFILHREGLIETTVKVKPVRGDVFTHWSHIFLDILWGIILLFLLFEASMLALDAYDREIFWLYIKDPYTWLDWVSIVVGVLIGWFFVGVIYQLDVFEAEVAMLGDAPLVSVNQAVAAEKVQAQQDAFDYQSKIAALFYRMGNVAWASEWHRLLCFAYSVVIICRFLRGFTGQPRVAVLIQTLLYCSDFLFHYLLVFIIVVGNFTLGAYILFGGQVTGWSTYFSSLSRVILVLFNQYEYEELYQVAPVTSAVWYMFFLIIVSMLLLNLLLASILHSYLEVRQRLGEPGIGLIQQCREIISDRAWHNTYEGAKKTAPNEELLRIIAADIDPHRVEKLGRLRIDRRLRTDADLKQAERSPIVTLEYLCKRGCSPADADRLLRRASDWKHSLTVTSSPSHRLMLLVARQMSYITREVDSMSTRTKQKIENSMRGVDRLDLKHAKSVALAKRIDRSQQLPPGWTAHVDEQGRRYLREEATGLTSWTLPRHLI